MQRLDASSIDLLMDDVIMAAESLQHPDCTMQMAGRFYEEATDALRAVAILSLLIHADVDELRSNLILSGRLRQHYLDRCRREGYMDLHGASSRAAPFFDAIAADDLDTARKIGLLSAGHFREGEEYEDDFCYVRLLGSRIDAGLGEAEVDELMQRFEAALEGAGSARLGICASLRTRDQRAFDASFDALLAERDAEVERERAGIAGEDVRAAAGTFIFVEGLAVLRVARRAGLATRLEYPYCPAIAMVWRHRAPGT